MELNNQNKAKFFAQYWGQKVGSTKKKFTHLTLNKSCFLNIDYLNLKPVSSITDEDAIEATVLYHGEKNRYRCSKSLYHSQQGGFDEYTKVADYLRSKGYALPWMGLSVEEMVQDGWIKLQEVKNG